MCKIKNLSIKKYRGIHSLEMLDLQGVNILLGNNNSSKSSVLETIYILMNANDPAIPIKLNVDRDYTGIKQTDFAAFFHNLDIKVPIELQALLDNGENVDLNISYQTIRINEFQPENIKSSTTPVANYGLLYNYKENCKQAHTTELLWDTEEEKIKIGETWEKSNRNTFFLAPRYNFNDFISHFNQIVTDKEKDYVLNALQAIEPRIADITVVNNHVMVDAGLDKLIPINLMGDGTRKLFTIITAMYKAKDGIILIDEIDNGLYYKSMKSLWKAVLFMSNKFNIQVFVSTHSIDSLNALNSLLEEEGKPVQNEVCILTLRKYDGDEITAYRYGYDDFNYLLNREEEIR